MKSKGFTLAELLISMAILGILASLAIPRLFPQSERARASEGIGILSAIRQGEESYFLENGAYLDIPPGSANVVWQQIGMDDPNPTANYFAYVIVAAAGPPPSFTATATRNAVNDGGGNAGKMITLDNFGNFGGGGNPHPNVPN